MLSKWEVTFSYCYSSIIQENIEMPMIEETEDVGKGASLWDTVPEKAGEDEILSTGRGITYRKESRVMGAKVGKLAGSVEETGVNFCLVPSIRWVIAV